MSTFISYSRANSDFAVRLTKDLKAAGFDIWLDQLDIPTGSRWDDEIEKSLERSSTFLIILSPDAIESQNVKDEVGYAIDSGKHIVPVITQPCKIPFRLRRFQYVDFSIKPYEENFIEIQKILRNPTPPSPDTTAGQFKGLKEFKQAHVKKAQSIQRRRLLSVFGIAGLCLLSVGGVTAVILYLSRFVPVTGASNTQPPAVPASSTPRSTATIRVTKDIMVTPTRTRPAPTTAVPPTTRAPVEESSVIGDRYADLGGAAGPLGQPIGNEQDTRDGQGRFRDYQRGSIYWSASTGAWEIEGSIRDKWLSLGAETGLLRYPITDETTTPDGIGRFNHFENGSIYWTPSTGAWEVHGNIRDKWASLGWETGILGYPITDETTTPDGIGRFNHFQNGSIYWTPSTGAWEVHGSIRDKWASLGWEQGVLRYPITDETVTPDGIGRFNHFENGSIYWTPSTGAWEIQGAIRDKWASLGWERSCLGYPISDEEPGTNGWSRQSRFERGIIQWSPDRGAVETCY